MGKNLQYIFYVLAAQHPVTLIMMTFSFCLENPPSLTLSLSGTRGFIPTPDIVRAGLIQGWLIRALHPFGPQRRFSGGLGPHQNQGNLWPEVRTLPAGRDWSWICEDIGARMASLIF